MTDGRYRSMSWSGPMSRWPRLLSTHSHTTRISNRSASCSERSPAVREHINLTLPWSSHLQTDVHITLLSFHQFTYLLCALIPNPCRHPKLPNCFRKLATQFVPISHGPCHLDGDAFRTFIDQAVRERGGLNLTVSELQARFTPD